MSPAPSRRCEPECLSAEQTEPPPKQRSLKEFGVILRPASSLRPISANACVPGRLATGTGRPGSGSGHQEVLKSASRESVKERINRLTFPREYIVGEALRIQTWIRSVTPDERRAHNNRWWMEYEGPVCELIYATGEIAPHNEPIGLVIRDGPRAP